MLSSVMKGGDTRSVVVTEDSLAESGIPLLKAFIKSQLIRLQKIHLILFEHESSVLTGDLQGVPVDHLQVHDFASDPLGWNGSSSLLDGSKLAAQLEKDVGSDACGVVIDCLTPLILHHSAPYTCQILHRLAQRHRATDSDVDQLVCTVHGDMHGSDVCDMLQHTATSWLSLHPALSPSQYTGLVQILHKRASGKILRVKEQYLLKESHDLLEVDEVKSIESLISKPENKPANPAADLTFNLTLTDKEKEARSQLVLPYIHDNQKKEVALMKTGGEGKIFYQPDEADDFDDEDPDDDLDI